MSYKVLITASGIGSRLGELTRHTNKALVRVGKKPAISYVIESYPKNTEFVITLGYKKNQVKDFLGMAYPERKFTFVTVEKYDGPGTSLGYSMLQAKDVLQAPFIFQACDTLVENFSIPSVEGNWAAGFPLDNFDQYASFSMASDGKILGFNRKKDGKSGDMAHIGLIGVHDYDQFWKTLEKLYKGNPHDSNLNDTATLSEMIKKGGVDIRGITVNTWLDIGNLEALSEARRKVSDHFNNLDKIDESLFFFKDFVIKFFSDPKRVKDRVKRGEILGRLVPKTLEVKDNFYKYEFIEGQRFSDVANASNITGFLNWSLSNLWKPVQEVSDEEFIRICTEFYEAKTIERIGKILSAEHLSDEKTVINDELVPPVKELLAMVDFEKLSRGLQTHFHGDYILENILQTKDGYMLLDWRQDFGGLLRAGDMYYDLAKFYHNLVVNHDIVSSNEFFIEVNGKNIALGIKRRDNLQKAKKAFESWVENAGLNLDKIRILRAIIWLNMSPLHHHPFNIFLFYFGKYYLWQALKNK